MRIRLLLGAAGSGKTYRCLTEARNDLAAAAEGPPLLLIAPKQGTYQLEQQLLADNFPAGYTRLRILSFEALAYFLLDQLPGQSARILEEEGRLMVLRSLLSKRRDSLKLFRASAKLTGFAQQLSVALREFQRHRVTPEMLMQLASNLEGSVGLAAKLEDLATLLQGYLDWLQGHQLQDPDSLLATAAKTLGATPNLVASRVWIDGFSDFSEQELDFLAALLPRCQEATLTFCLDAALKQNRSWLSHWWMMDQTFENCRKRLAAVPGVEIEVQVIPADAAEGRFTSSPVLKHLATHWSEPQPCGPVPRAQAVPPLRVVICADPEAETRVAAREILRHIRGGGRYREISVLVRHLEGYHAIIQRVFSRYDIPFFLDRRESVTHHPLAELTRSALRTVAFGWQHEDWFAALKSGLMPLRDQEIDLLENEALARGWNGDAWRKPFRLRDNTRSDQERQRLLRLEEHLERLRRESVIPFEELGRALTTTENKLSGPQLGAAVRAFWEELRIPQRLSSWDESESRRDTQSGVSVHETVWNQINSWLDNAALAFPDQALGLKEWLPILEAGLANLTVGIIPPALDQVLVGAVDRSRTPNVKLALVLGLNETIFPARPSSPGLLNEADREQLQKHNLLPPCSSRHQLSRERYLFYIACTRACERLVLTCALRDAQGAPLNQSSFLSPLRRLFPDLEFESGAVLLDWRTSEHVNELIGPLMKLRRDGSPGAAKLAEQFLKTGDAAEPAARAAFSPCFATPEAGSRQPPQSPERLSTTLVERLYGPALRSSVSRLEQFAACPFKFFIHSGLRAEERKRFELDIKEQGTFQHDVLALFHEELQKEGKGWRDVTPTEARARVAAIAEGLLAGYRQGLLNATEQTRFLARVLSESLQDFIETLVSWMREQYEFEPVAVEMAFGADSSWPGWTLDLGEGHKLVLEGRIDRIDLHRNQTNEEASCVVIDYKSSQKQLDPVLIDNGLQLQLLTYLNVLRRWPDPGAVFGVKRLTPAGVFYVSLRGQYERQTNRTRALSEAAAARKMAYRHCGRFDGRFLPQLDSRPEVQSGDQFNYRRSATGRIYRNCREALDSAQFEALLDSVEQNLKEMGQAIFSGEVSVAPYRKSGLTACDQCQFQPVCRIDPLTQPYRVLKVRS